MERLMICFALVATHLRRQKVSSRGPLSSKLVQQIRTLFVNMVDSNFIMFVPTEIKLESWNRKQNRPHDGDDGQFERARERRGKMLNITIHSIVIKLITHSIVNQSAANSHAQLWSPIFYQFGKISLFPYLTWWWWCGCCSSPHLHVRGR